MSFIYRLWPHRLRSPHWPLDSKFTDVRAWMMSQTDGVKAAGTDDDRKRFIAIETNDYRCVVTEDPESALLYSVSYSDRGGSLWQQGTRRRMRIYMERYSEGGRWRLIVKEHGYHYMWRNELTGQRAIYGLHADVLSFHADRPKRDEETIPQTESEVRRPKHAVLCDDGRLSGSFLNEFFDTPEGCPSSELDRLEAKLGEKLPLQYRHFLEYSNGGGSNFSCYQDGKKSMYVQYIYGVERSDEGELDGIEGQIEMHGGPFGRKKLIPIARGGQSDFVFISLVDGSIHYREDDGTKMELWAPSLADFLGRLTDGFDDSAFEPEYFE